MKRHRHALKSLRMVTVAKEEPGGSLIDEYGVNILFYGCPAPTNPPPSASTSTSSPLPLLWHHGLDLCPHHRTRGRRPSVKRAQVAESSSFRHQNRQHKYILTTAATAGCLSVHTMPTCHARQVSITRASREHCADSCRWQSSEHHHLGGGRWQTQSR